MPKGPVAYKTQPGFFDFKQLYDEVVEQLDYGIIVEVGVWFGRSIIYLGELIKQSGKDIRVYGVDPWVMKPKYKVHFNGVVPTGDEILQSCYNAIERAGLLDIISLIRSPSFNASYRFNDKSLDFVFLDGDHSYDSVKKDILVWRPTIKDGGMLAGHDYDWPEVKQAVESFKLPTEVFQRCWKMRF